MLKMKSSNLCVMICWSCLLPFTGCDDELKDPVIPNEEELITTLTYRLIPTEGGETVVLTYKDLDEMALVRPLFLYKPCRHSPAIMGCSICLMNPNRLAVP